MFELFRRCSYALGTLQKIIVCRCVGRVGDVQVRGWGIWSISEDFDWRSTAGISGGSAYQPRPAVGLWGQIP